MRVLFAKLIAFAKIRFILHLTPDFSVRRKVDNKLNYVPWSNSFAVLMVVTNLKVRIPQTERKIICTFILWVAILYYTKTFEVSKRILFFAKYVDYFKIEILQCTKSNQKYR